MTYVYHTRPALHGRTYCGRFEQNETGEGGEIPSILNVCADREPIGRCSPLQDVVPSCPSLSPSRTLSPEGCRPSDRSAIDCMAESGTLSKQSVFSGK
jgi:hypothetical protein